MLMNVFLGHWPRAGSMTSSASTSIVYLRDGYPLLIT
jgi:hypothetical protein